MKKYNYILLGMLSLFFVTTLTSCSDYFDQVPDDRLSLEEIFKTRNIFRMFIPSCRMSLISARYMKPACIVHRDHGPERVMKPNGLHQAIKPN